MSNKIVVHYSKLLYIEVGGVALVETVDHPSPLVSNKEGIGVRTSEVLSYDEETGDFETRNTLYKKWFV